MKAARLPVCNVDAGLPGECGGKPGPEPDRARGPRRISGHSQPLALQPDEAEVPGRGGARIVALVKQQHIPSASREAVCRGEPNEPAADHNHIFSFRDRFHPELRIMANQNSTNEFLAPFNAKILYFDEKGPELNFRTLTAFRAVMVAGSVTDASAALGRSQPAVSRSIADLEASVGYQLFERVNRRMVPTEEAVLLFKEVERAFQSLDYITEAARAIGGRRRRHIHVAAMPAIAFSILPIVAQMMTDAYPEVQMMLEVRSSDWVLQSILQRQCDVGIAGLPLNDPGLSVAFIATASAVCVLPRGHRLAKLEVIGPTDIAGEPFISLGASFRTRQMVDRIFREASIERDMRLETQLSEMACLLVERGLGIAIVDPFTPHLRPDLKLDVRPFLPEIPYEWGAVTQAGRHIAPPVAQFLEILKDSVTGCKNPKARISLAARPHSTGEHP
ncbi:MAG: LysR family transcriptional regulator [Oricola sp.]